MQNIGIHECIGRQDQAIDFVGEDIVEDPPFVGALYPERDYVHIKKSMDLVQKTSQHIQSKQGSIAIPVSERYWEYGSAVHLAEEYTQSHKTATVLNVGSGWDGLSPTLAALDDYNITECEPDTTCRNDRLRVNEILVAENHKPIKILSNGLFNLPEEKFDLVFCISVLEHVFDEQQAWYNLSQRVTLGGILFITVDVVDDATRPHAFDGARVTNYTLDILKHRVSMIKERGFETIGEPDYEWHGIHVYDYNFFRAGFKKVK